MSSPGNAKNTDSATQPNCVSIPVQATEDATARREKNRKKSEPPVLTKQEQLGNSVTHGIGAVLSVIAMVLMLVKAATPVATAAAAVYGVCMFLLFSMSCIYHALPTGSRIKRVWRRCDYSSIYLLIGGTFAPILLAGVGTTVAKIAFGIQWGLIAAGILVLVICGPGRFRPLHFTFYFTIGWSGLLFMPTLWHTSPPLVLFILIGGVVYTLGMIPFVKKQQKYMHLLWHFFVLVGAVLHWIGIYLYIL